MRFSATVPFLCAPLFVSAQQFQGDIISAYLPTVSGAEVAFWRVNTPNADSYNTLVNYQSLGSNGQRVNNANVRRAVISIHGLLRDPWNYCNDTLDALAKVSDGNINRDSVLTVCPYFTNGDDKGFAFPWDDAAAPGAGSTSNALVWSGSQWSAGADNHYPHSSRHTSSFYVLDQLVSAFADASVYPSLNQIVLVGHSLGGQMLQRYAAVGAQLNTRVPVVYWIGNPDSYAWLSEDRPLSIAACPEYDSYRNGFSQYQEYSSNMTYGVDLVNQGRQAVLDNYNTRQIAYARALYDHGNEATGCEAATSGIDRNERFFFFIKSFPPSCSDPTSRTCDTVDLVPAAHDNGQMFGSPAGRARLFTDNFYGDGSRAYDFGYPRSQYGDDPFPDPSLQGTTGATNFNSYTAKGLTYQGCWTDQQPVTAAALEMPMYDNFSNTQATCAQACVDAGYSIAGVVNSSQCRCGSAMDSASAVLTVDAECNFPCSGDASTVCGGQNRMGVFSAGYPVFSGTATTKRHARQASRLRRRHHA